TSRRSNGSSRSWASGRSRSSSSSSSSASMRSSRTCDLRGPWASCASRPGPQVHDDTTGKKMAEFEDARAVWDRRFSEADGLLFGAEPNAWLAEHHGLLPAGGRVLCVADGESRNGVFLASAGFQVTAFDISSVAVDKARALAAERGVQLELFVADIESWHFEPDAFDAVVAIFIQFAGPDLRARLFEGFQRTIRPGGVLLIEGYGERQLRYRTGGPGVPE